MSSDPATYLGSGLPRPAAIPSDPDFAFWNGLNSEQLLIQRCNSCHRWQWGPEHICHMCHSFDLRYEQVLGAGTIYSYQRVWHPVHPALVDHVPYLIVLVELDDVPSIRLAGNLLGDPNQAVHIDSHVTAVFEHHEKDSVPFTLLQWKLEEVST